jgi:hypothetical protein
VTAPPAAADADADADADSDAGADSDAAAELAGASDGAAALAAVDAPPPLLLQAARMRVNPRIGAATMRERMGVLQSGR